MEDFDGTVQVHSVQTQSVEEDLESISVASTCTRRGKRRKVDTNFEKLVESQNKKLDLFENLLKTPEKPENELTIFFKSMEVSTRKLPLAQQMRIKHGISKLVWDAEEEHDVNVMQVFVVEDQNQN